MDAPRADLVGADWKETETEAKGDEELPTRLSISFRQWLHCTAKHSTLCLPASLQLMYDKVL